MMKLIDYFVIVGYDEESDEEKNSDEDDDGDGDDYDDEMKFKSRQKKANALMSSSIGKARIIQRFPLPCDKSELSLARERRQSLENTSNTDAICENNEQQEFDENIHCFCQPHKGWRLYAKQEAPTFFVSVLTDIKGKKKTTKTNFG